MAQGTERTQNRPLASRPGLAERGLPRGWGRGRGRPAPVAGEREPGTLGRGDPSARGAQATRALALTRSGDGRFWRRRRQALGPSTQGCPSRSASRSIFLPHTHRPTHVPTGAARAGAPPTGDPYRPRGARRKPRPIRAPARRARARARDPPPRPIGAGGWAGRLRDGGALGAGRGRAELLAGGGPGPAPHGLARRWTPGAAFLFVVLFSCFLCVYAPRPRWKLQANACGSAKKRNPQRQLWLY